MVKDIQIDPVTNTLIHADFKRVDMEKKIRVKVPIVFEGMAFGVKNQGGMVDMIMREVEVECLPAVIPDRLHVDLTPLKIGEGVKVGDLKVAEGIRIAVEDHHLPVVVISAPKVEAAAATEAEGEAEASRSPRSSAAARRPKRARARARARLARARPSKGKRSRPAAGHGRGRTSWWVWEIPARSTTGAPTTPVSK